MIVTFNFRFYIISICECTLSRSWFTQSVSINVVWFLKKIKRTLGLNFDSLKKVECFLGVGLSSILLILKPYSFDLDTFFQIQKTFKLNSKFHFNITHFRYVTCCINRTFYIKLKSESI
jgi:hypothetical protein